MRQSYRDKQSRKARINREKEQNKMKKNVGGDASARTKKSKFSKNDNNNYSNKLEQGKSYDDIVFGRNSVLELLKSDKDINKIFIERGEKHRFY